MSEPGLSTSTLSPEAEEIGLLQRHSSMRDTLHNHVAAMVSAAYEGDGHALSAARRDLISWCWTDVLTLEGAEERILLPAAAGLPGLEALLGYLPTQVGRLQGLLDETGEANDVIAAIAGARGLAATYDLHCEAKAVVLRALADSPEHDVTAVSAQVEEAWLGESEALKAQTSGGCACGSGGCCSS